MEDRCKTCAHFGEMSEYDWCHECAMECNHYKPTGDMISRKAAIEALGERPDNWTDTPEEVQAVNDWDSAVYAIKSVPSVPAVPLDKLCEWLAKNSMNIPCESCQHYSNQYCLAIGDMSKPCPRTKDDWRVAITKWMEELDEADRC